MFRMHLMRRGLGEVIRIMPKSNADPVLAIREVLARPIDIMLVKAENGAARFAIFSDPRWMLVTEEETHDSSPKEVVHAIECD